MNFARVVDLQGERPGKTLLITGGMDGDEYAGIEAAKRLATEFETRTFSGRLMIIPTVNVPGFEAGVSYNPLDQRFPKFVFPGRARGSSTEQLIHWLNTNYISQADMWYDLHGGASDEQLTPFLWTYRTNIKKVDALSEKLHQIVPANIILDENAGWFTKARALARREINYVIAESGELGTVKEEDVERHVIWAKCIMSVLNMIDPPTDLPVYQPTHLHHLSFIHAHTNGPWDIRSQKISGTPLWWKKAEQVKKGDLLAAIGS